MLELELNDQCWDIVYGFGKVLNINSDKTFCYEVEFNNFHSHSPKFETYNKEGKRGMTGRTLFKESHRKYYTEDDKELLYIGEPLDKPILTIPNGGGETYVITPSGNVHIIKIDFINNFDTLDKQYHIDTVTRSIFKAHNITSDIPSIQIYFKENLFDKGGDPVINDGYSRKVHTLIGMDPSIENNTVSFGLTDSSKKIINSSMYGQKANDK